MKKIVFVLAVLLLLTSFSGCKKEPEIVTDGSAVFYNMYQFMSAIRMTQRKIANGEELNWTDIQINTRIKDEFPYPTTEIDGYELHSITVGAGGLQYHYVYGDFRTMQKDKTITITFWTNINYTTEELEAQKAEYVKRGAVYYPEDNVIYFTTGLMYFQYNNAWSHVLVTSNDLNTYDQLLVLCQYEIISVYDANTPVQTTGTQATSAKATATN